MPPSPGEGLPPLLSRALDAVVRIVRTYVVWAGTRSSGASRAVAYAAPGAFLVAAYLAFSVFVHSNGGRALAEQDPPVVVAVAPFIALATATPAFVPATATLAAPVAAAVAPVATRSPSPPSAQTSSAPPQAQPAASQPTLASAASAPASAAPSATPRPSTPLAAVPTPRPATTVTQPASTAGPCSPAYPTVCIPPPPPDLDCKDIPYRRFTVLAPDPHRFDADKNGIGCESP